MEKRILILLLVALLGVCILSSCGGTYSNPADNAANEEAHLVPIDGKNYLSYSEDTGVVYYMFSTTETYGHQGYGYTYFAPYISENGNFCRYVDGQIVEITAQASNTAN